MPPVPSNFKKKKYLIVPPPLLPSRPLNSKKSYIKKQWWFGKLGPRKMNYWYLLFCGNFYSQYYCSMYIYVYMYQLLENCIVLLVWYVLKFFSYCFYFQILFYFSIVLSWYTFHFCVHKVCLSDLEWIEWNIKRQYVLVLIVFTN